MHKWINLGVMIGSGVFMILGQGEWAQLAATLLVAYNVYLLADIIY